MKKMTLSQTNIRKSVQDFCIEISNNTLLVQGAGGNVSWKQDNILWIKASGTWVSDAWKKDIFVPVDLQDLRIKFKNNNFNGELKLRHDLKKTELRPSIETSLHALMPQKIVVHLHAIDVLAYLVCKDSYQMLSSLIPNNIKYAYVDYFKPGVQLAQAVHKTMGVMGNVDLLLMQNHGIVICGRNLEKIKDLLNILIGVCKFNPEHYFYYGQKVKNSLSCKNGTLNLLSSSEINQLALNQDLFKLIDPYWSLYPDHVVFLGAKPVCFSTFLEAEKSLSAIDTVPKLVFIKGCGVYVWGEEYPALMAQLKCYADILVRLQNKSKVRTLSASNIEELLDWEAEKYRQKLNDY